MKLKFLTTLVLLASTTVALAAPSAQASSTQPATATASSNNQACPALVMVKDVANQLIDTLKKDQAQLKQNPQKATEIVKQILVPHVDAEAMAATVVGPQWRTMTAKQRQDFSDAFLNLVVKTYSSALNDYSDQRIVFSPMRRCAATGSQMVDSKVLSSSAAPANISYSVICKKAGDPTSCKLYNLTVEGIGMLNNFGVQIQALFQQGKTPDQVTQMLKAQGK